MRTCESIEIPRDWPNHTYVLIVTLVIIISEGVTNIWFPHLLHESFYGHTHGGFEPRYFAHWSTLGLYLSSGKTYYRQKSWSLKAARLGAIMIVLFWNFTGISAALLSRCLKRFKPEYHGFATSWDLFVRRPSTQWLEALVQISIVPVLQSLLSQYIDMRTLAEWCPTYG